MTDAVLLSMLDRPCTIIGRSQTGPVDRYNEPTWLETSEPTVCYIEQTDTREITVGRNTGIATHLGVLPSGTVIDDSDRIEVGSTTYEVLGPPARLWEPELGESHVEVALREVE